jgi:formylglycine-generating enzyme required for sulfatase activity
MEKVCYNEIRLKANSNGGASASEIANYSWPKAPFPSSFLGLLRSKTGLDFDLPGEAQWEFAARAGHGSGFWGDGSVVKNNDTDANLNRLGRNERNGGRIYNGSSYGNPAASCGFTNGTAVVGSYAPNDWGLYDVHGNVWELCLDWISDDISDFGGRVNIDPESPALNLSGTSGTTRVMRGGSWYYGAGNCRPAVRNSFSSPTSRGNDGGFRVVCTAGLR